MLVVQFAMSLSFAKAPLVEIIAELRWVPPQAQAASGAFPIPFIGDTKQEEFLMRLGSKIQNLGFAAPERLVPPGFVTLLHQPIYRFRRAPDPSPVLYQVGTGIFSAHGLPPYSSWDNFSPDVERGIAALLDTRDPKERTASFSRVSLRYIDAFNKELTSGRDEVAFMRDVLRISIDLPATVVKLVEPGATPTFGLQIAFAAGNGMMMNLNLAGGTVRGEEAIIMDTTVSHDGGAKAEVAETMTLLHSAHDIIHKAFLELTVPIYDLMQPRDSQ